MLCSIELLDYKQNELICTIIGCTSLTILLDLSELHLKFIWKE